MLKSDLVLTANGRQWTRIRTRDRVLTESGQATAPGRFLQQFEGVCFAREQPTQLSGFSYHVHSSGARGKSEATPPQNRNLDTKKLNSRFPDGYLQLKEGAVGSGGDHFQLGLKVIGELFADGQADAATALFAGSTGGE